MVDKIIQWTIQTAMLTRYEIDPPPCAFIPHPFQRGGDRRRDRGEEMQRSISSPSLIGEHHQWNIRKSGELLRPQDGECPLMHAPQNYGLGSAGFNQIAMCAASWLCRSSVWMNVCISLIMGVGSMRERAFEGRNGIMLQVYPSPERRSRHGEGMRGFPAP
ncbi:hypothetical protein BD779DRAFT_1580017 [Infundibulicybe gibba]|nr:hypothetical protein BD779DRAFT_1580017 [Infundibulicybe gibba]